MDVLFTVIGGPHRGREFMYSRHDTFIVGRSKRAHLQLPDKDKYFSRVHFLVEVNPPHCRIVDMNSHNGTYVNEQRILVADLRDGDRIKAGHTILQVTIRQTLEAQLNLPRAERTGRAPPTLSWHGPAGGAEGVDLFPGTEALGPKLPAVPGYEMVRELGRGGMGIVYLARRAADGCQVALKTITPATTLSSSKVQRFLGEANILQQLRHPHIVAFRAMGEAHGLLYFAMDYVAGTNAAALINEHGKLPVRAAVRLTCQVLQALEFAHAQGFVHRDIKPANLLLADTARGKQAKLADFGLARVYQSSQLSGLNLSDDVGGTLKFMAPEQITNYREVKPLTDQYGAAATLYYLLTARHVYDFGATNAQPLLVIMQEDIIPIQYQSVNIPDGLAEAIHRALQRAPEKRFANVAALRQALLPFAR